MGFNDSLIKLPLKITFERCSVAQVVLSDDGMSSDALNSPVKVREIIIGKSELFKAQLNVYMNNNFTTMLTDQNYIARRTK